MSSRGDFGVLKGAVGMRFGNQWWMKIVTAQMSIRVMSRTSLGSLMTDQRLELHDTGSLVGVSFYDDSFNRAQMQVTQHVAHRQPGDQQFCKDCTGRHCRRSGDGTSRQAAIRRLITASWVTGKRTELAIKQSLCASS